MATGTYFKPTRLIDMENTSLEGAGQGVSAVCGPGIGTTTNLDITLTDDVIATGLVLVVAGASLGDYVTMQVLLNGTVVKTPLPGPWYLPQTNTLNFDFVMPIKIIAGLTLRIIYTNTGLLVTPYLAVNYKLWKVLQ